MNLKVGGDCSGVSMCVGVWVGGRRAPLPRPLPGAGDYFNLVIPLGRWAQNLLFWVVSFGGMAMSKFLPFA